MDIAVYWGSNQGFMSRYQKVKMKISSCSPLTNLLVSASTAALEVFETDVRSPPGFLARASDGREFGGGTGTTRCRQASCSGDSMPDGV